MVMMTSAAARLLLLNVLLESREIRLRRRKIAGFQVLPQLCNGLRNRTLGLRRGLRAGCCVLLLAGDELLERGEIALRLRQITRLEILTELLEILLNLLEPVLDWRRRTGTEKAS